MIKGFILLISPNRKYGIIKSNKGTGISFSFSDVIEEDPDLLSKGDSVLFEIKKTQYRTVAVKVKLDPSFEEVKNLFL